ncbi:SDR family NAD(P)-dependent oxidoreductase [Psychrobacter pacificensis]|uniref:SDR family NAD(P)-dependent oxidoreductase n=1 Tax=Psychrobacter pacificensis TaxID=112002 RepID=UPI001CBFA24E|nr:SDR family NAD(P)-dependent oxidoreductase [Psychrobacter pacificensis]MBZ1392567.1 SDR family NAD(P)-dependent oxidoreductase [Psychrobacter pacificensis]MDE0843679.1 SDR family NAD(P)-dependent oxidoreductase [Psychrobacter pacificensis]|tara:strand:+ start:485 stop:1237 length:753 start_codon:yes stop_codon:yes gene_type:complete
MNVLITGASAGFGKALAERLVANGHRVIGCARRIDKLNALAEILGENFLPVMMDVSDTDSIPQIIADLPDDFKHIDVLVNNAGLALGTEPAHKASLDDWMQMVDTNVKGLMSLTHAVLPDMVERDSGYIINVGSIAGSWPYFGGNVYGATKAFVKQFSLNLRADLVGTQVRVTNIEPGVVAGTEFSNVRYHGDDDKAAKVYDGFKTMTGEDIGDILLWLIESPAHINVNRLEVMPVAQTYNGLTVAKKDR